MLPTDIKKFSSTLEMVEAGHRRYDLRLPQHALLTHVADIYLAMRACDPDPTAFAKPTAPMLEAGREILTLPRPATHLKPLRVLEIYYAMRKAQES